MAGKTDKKKGGFMAGVKNFAARVTKFFRDTVGEMKKVTWPSKPQIINNTLVVLAVVAIAGVAIFLLDSIFGAALNLLLQIAG